MLTISKYGIPGNILLNEYNFKKKNWEAYPEIRNFPSNHTRFIYFFDNKYFVGNQRDGCQNLISCDGGKIFKKA